MLTRDELNKRLRAMLDIVKEAQSNLPIASAPQARFDAIRDQLLLIALDVGLPVQPARPSQEAQDEQAGQKT